MPDGNWNLDDKLNNWNSIKIIANNSPKLLSGFEHMSYNQLLFTISQILLTFSLNQIKSVILQTMHNAFIRKLNYIA